MAFSASSRPTREWPLLILALALVCAITIPLWQYTRAGETDAVAHRDEEGRARRELELVGDAVHGEGDRDPHAALPKSDELAGTSTASPRARATAAVRTRLATTSAIARR